MTWTVPVAGGPLLAQVFEHHYGDTGARDASWPEARLQVFPAEPRGGKVNPFLGVVGSRMSWTVWTIGQGGQVGLGARGPTSASSADKDGDVCEQWAASTLGQGGMEVGGTQRR